MYKPSIKSINKIIVWHIMLGAFALLFLFVYLFNVNNITGDRFVIDEMRSSVKELKQEHYTLSVRAVDSRSIKNLERKVEGLNLEEVKQVSYIRAKSASPLVLNDN